MYFKKSNYKLYFLLCFIVAFSMQSVYSQMLIGKPTFPFTKACASDGFNTYSTTFNFNPTSALEASNQFTVELSDPNGDFSNPNNITILYTSAPGEITTSPATVNFSFPETIAGENYALRIRSSAPNITSNVSDTFPAYYKLQDSPFTINNMVPTAEFCFGGSYLLTIDNPGIGNNDSPLNYPSLSFKWYKETGPTSSIFVADGPSLNVVEAGTYFVKTDYGSCTSNSFSNRVAVDVANSGQVETSITASLGEVFCPIQGPNTLTTSSGNSYKWYKNDIEIIGATSQSYDTTESGVYSVEVNYGGCSALASIEIESQMFDAEINVNQDNIIEDGESLYVSITSTANSPEYRWFRDDVQMLSMTQDSYDIDTAGNYKVVVTETQGCEASINFRFKVTKEYDLFPDVANIPNLISPNGDHINDTWILPTKYISGTNTQITIFSNRGEVVFQTNEYLNNWPEENLNPSSVNQVYYYVITTSENEVKKGSITVIK